MKKTLIIAGTLLSLTATLTASPVDSVYVRIDRTGSDSLTGWSKTFEFTDSISQGKTIASLKRRWVNNSWMNVSLTRYSFSADGKISVELNADWNGQEFQPVQKRLVSYAATGLMNSETFYFNTGGNWAPVSRNTFEYNTAEEQTSESLSNWSGTTWELSSLKTRCYYGSTSLPACDSTYIKSDGYWYPVQAVFYDYTGTGQLMTLSTQDLFSYLVSDPDTEYIFSDVEREYTVTTEYDAAGNVLATHGVQTWGSSQSWSFNYTYYISDGMGHSVEFNHSGTNNQDYFSSTDIYHLAPLAIHLEATPASCASCNDGTIQMSISGGYAPYLPVWTPYSGINTGSGISGLHSGNYTFTVEDELGSTATAAVEVGLNLISGILNNDVHNFSLYPAISTGEIFLENNSGQTLKTVIYDLTGKICITSETTSGQTVLNLESLSNGTYMYRVAGTGILYSGKLILSH